MQIISSLPKTNYEVRFKLIKLRILHKGDPCHATLTTSFAYSLFLWYRQKRLTRGAMWKWEA